MKLYLINLRMSISFFFNVGTCEQDEYLLQHIHEVIQGIGSFKSLKKCGTFNSNYAAQNIKSIIN